MRAQSTKVSARGCRCSCFLLLPLLRMAGDRERAKHAPLQNGCLPAEWLIACRVACLLSGYDT